ncbi:MAG: hypothetical protein EOP56_00435 [Sphingobacteriales bacterium]|nr:MAG: hypothetical protein EOP56_00435 [Sphingobacteriales bacterium]
MKLKASKFSLQYYTSVHDLPKSWDDLLPTGHYLERLQLAISESAALPNITHVYIQISIQGHAVAAASFQALRLQSKHLNEETFKPYQHTLWSLFTAIRKPVLLVAGHLFRHDVQSYYYDSSMSAFDSFSIYQEAIKLASCRTCASAVLVKDVDEQMVTYFQHFAPKYFMLRNDISMELEIPEAWNAIADYGHALKHKYAQRYRKIRQAWQNVTVAELSTPEVLGRKLELFDLYKQVSLKQQVRLGFLSPDYLPMLKEQNGNALKVWAVFEEGKMVAFFSAWVEEQALDMFYIGFDYERNNELQLYFNMLFFGLEQAILLSKQKLIMGRTALDAKARMGCRPRYLNTFLYIKNGLVRTQVMRMQSNASAGEGEWEQRHPFKK